ncbi:MULTISPECIES: sugar ABC transporter permease [Arthrobacter]|uniref:Sorbitol/mannitol transport system permease protein n=1 Tax=Arthrobacter bambusae TaxID=1338426 RepID=A0AAW8DEN3_9MICC|nr:MULTISPECIES: sugar ABC transporter permease [Arthrobacter]MDP9907286.1 sorbitol/mannitol transport system permease protein [Arthrobacter bambusae]MDQ0131422.1 sorbitol/mannitol transport system permease protein [Arthrobacter bambusae]MDQ0182756.1 sorbitol/mannitol transport system permease protein [Arthrobacter bambusae]
MSSVTKLASRTGQRAPRNTNGAKARERAVAWARRAPLLPALVFLIVVTQLPFVATLVISFLNWNSLRPDQTGFAGFGNYVQVLTNPDLRQAIITTVILTASVVLASLAIGLGLALLLDKKFIGRGLARTLLIAPFLIVPVAAALVWKHALLNPTYGLINGTLTWIWSLFGSNTPPQPDLLSQTPLLAVIMSLVWQWTPFMMLILLAGLQSKPADVIEAAQMDGATPFQIFRYITLPHLRQYLELGGLLGAIYIVQNFDAVFTLTSGGLGTANLPYAIYQTFYFANEYGLASATGVVVVIGTIVVATFALRTVFSLFKKEAAR